MSSYGQYIVGGTAIVLDHTNSSGHGIDVPSGTTSVQIAVTGQAVRYRGDGTDPTATIGYPILAGTQITFFGNIRVVKFIAQSSSATLDVIFN